MVDYILRAAAAAATIDRECVYCGGEGDGAVIKSKKRPHSSMRIPSEHHRPIRQQQIPFRTDHQEDGGELAKRAPVEGSRRRRRSEVAAGWTFCKKIREAISTTQECNFKIHTLSNVVYLSSSRPRPPPPRIIQLAG